MAGATSWAEMLEREANLPAAERIEAVAIVTPNHIHAAPAIAALDAGFDVIIDKPLADTLANAQAIADAMPAAWVTMKAMAPQSSRSALFDA